MGFELHYRPLCDVSIRHGFHLNKGKTEFDDLSANEQKRKLDRFDIFDDLGLFIPDETNQVMRGLGLLAKAGRTGFTVASLVDEPKDGVFIPRRRPRGNFRLRFVLKSRQPLFWDYTNLDLRPRGRDVYYLSNRVDEAGGVFPYLSLPPANYETGTKYIAGDIVRPGEASNSRYIAVTSHTAPATGMQHWLRVGDRNYVNSTDKVRLYPRVFPFTFPDDTVAEAKVSFLPFDGDRYELKPIKAGPGQTLSTVSVDASSVPAGRYDLRVEAIDGSGFNYAESVYLDSELAAQDAFAIIELFHVAGEALGPFRFYDEASDFRLREPQYQIQLLNRYTFWRYSFPDPVPDGTDLRDLEKAGDRYVTTRIMPLTRGVERIEFAKEDTFLPNPPGGPITVESDRVYSDVHLHINYT